jgi:hypothetical protein
VVLGQKVDELAFGLVTPLQSDNTRSSHPRDSNCYRPSKHKHTSLGCRWSSGQRGRGLWAG